MTSSATAPTLVRTASHQYFFGDRELLGVTRVLDLVGITDFSAPWFSDWHRDRGAMVHQMVALENEGALDEGTLDERLVGYLTGYRLFRAEVGGEVERSETLVSDLTIGAAGTLDLIVQHSADHALRRRLFDIKPADYPATSIQLAAYARMAKSLYDRPVAFSRAALVIPGDGTYRVIPYDDPHDEQTFLAALRVAHWQVAHGRR
jgi:hypothetical protein